MTKQNRIHWVDYAKGIGIFLVVLGHVCRGLKLSSVLDPLFAASIDRWIYAFHMPIFFFLSGLLVKHSVSKPLKTFVIDKLKTLAYPYFVWSVIQGLLIYMTSHYTNSSISLSNILGIIYQPILIFWFFYVLFIISIFYKLACDLKASSIHFLIFSLILYCLHLIQPPVISWEVMDLVCRFTIYFALGAAISDQLMPRLNQISVFTLISITISGFLAITAIVWLNLAENQLFVPLIAMIGVSATIALSILLEQFKFANFIKLWGLLSLQIYVAHTLCTSGTRVLLQNLFNFTNPFIHITLGTILGIYAPIALNWLCQQGKFPYLFVFRSKSIA